MAGTIKGITIEIAGDTQKLNKSLEDVNKRSKDIQSELKQVERLLKLDPGNTELLAQKQKLLAEAVSNSKEKLDRLKTAQEQVNEQFRKGEINEEQYRAFQREVVKSEQELSGLEKQLKETTNATKTFEQKMQDTGAKLKDVGVTLTKTVTAGIAAVGGVAFAAATDFDKASKIIRAGAGATGEALEGLEDDFKAVFKEVPAGADTVAAAIADLNTRTGATGEQLQTLATRAVELAKLTGGDVSNQIAAVTRVFGDWSIATEDQAKTMDYLWNVSQSTGIGVDALAQKVVQFGAPLRQMGFDFETSAALIGKWEKEGVNAELVLGSLRIALGKMAKEGITDTNASLTEMTKRIKEAGSTGEANTLAMELFGSKAGPDMAAAIREGRFEIDDLLKTLKESPETILRAAEDTRTFGDNMIILKNNAETALAPLGSALLDTFNAALPAIKEIADKIASLAEKFSEISPAGQKLVLVIAGIAAAIGPLLMVLGPLLMALPGLVGILGGAGAAAGVAAAGTGLLGGALAAITGPIGIAVAAIAGIVAAFVALYNNNEDFRDRVDETWTEIKTSIKDAIDQITAWWQEWGSSIMAVINPIWETIKTIVMTVMKVIGETIALILNVVTGDWKGAGENIINIAQVLWDGLTGIFGGIKDTLTAATNLLTEVMLDKWEKFKNGLIAIWGAITGAIKGFINNQLQFVNKLIDALNSIKVEIPEWVPVFGGQKFGIDLPHVPMLATGTNYVPKDMLAYLHKGEAVVPAKYNPANTTTTVIKEIHVHGNNADEIWSKFERKLYRHGVVF